MNITLRYLLFKTNIQLSIYIHYTTEYIIGSFCYGSGYEVQLIKPAFVLYYDEC